LKKLALAALFLLVVEFRAAAAEGVFWCEHPDECEPVPGEPIVTAWQSPAPADALADALCSGERFPSAVGICEGEVAAMPTVPKPLPSCDGASCFPTDGSVPPAPPTSSHSHPFALLAAWRAPALRGDAWGPIAERPLEDGFPRRLDRPPRVSL
jgi:hypothetical protein